MQIQFKQAEIMVALKQYIIAQGINIAGKSVDIAFSATRGAAGIVADVTIEDAQIPGFSDAESDAAEASATPAAPVLSVVPAPPAAKAAESVTEAPAVQAPVAEDPPFAVAEAPVETPKTTSLFN